MQMTLKRQFYMGLFRMSTPSSVCEMSCWRVADPCRLGELSVHQRHHGGHHIGRRTGGHQRNKNPRYCVACRCRNDLDREPVTCFAELSSSRLSAHGTLVPLVRFARKRASQYLFRLQRWDLFVAAIWPVAWLCHLESRKHIRGTELDGREMTPGLQTHGARADALHLWIGIWRGAQLGADRQPPKLPGLQTRGNDRHVQASPFFESMLVVALGCSCCLKSPFHLEVFAKVFCDFSTQTQITRIQYSYVAGRCFVLPSP